MNTSVKALQELSKTATDSGWGPTLRLTLLILSVQSPIIAVATVGCLRLSGSG